MLQEDERSIMRVVCVEVVLGHLDLQCSRSDFSSFFLVSVSRKLYFFALDPQLGGCSGFFLLWVSLRCSSVNIPRSICGDFGDAIRHLQESGVAKTRLANDLIDPMTCEKARGTQWELCIVRSCVK